MHLFYTTEKTSSKEFLSLGFALVYPEREMPIICKTAGGKPYFKDTDDIFFSITHDGDVTAVAFSAHPVGIDYCQKTPRDLETFLRRFATKEEADKVLGAKDRHRAFCAFWSAKESFVKLTGEGLKGITKCTVSDRFVTSDTLTAHLLLFPLAHGALALCSEEKRECKIERLEIYK